MITVNNVSLRFGKRTLFEGVNLKFTPGNCYGIIGANGAGKSTFLKLLSGEIETTSGEINIGKDERISVLKQDHNLYNDYRVIDTVIMGNKRLYEIIEEKNFLYTKEPFTDKDGIKLGELESEFAFLNGWQAESDAAILLSGLGVDIQLHELTMKEIPTKEKVKVLLAQALFGNPDVLLLDEPTNHLDLDTKDFIIEYLKQYNGMILVISHDTSFLNEVTTKTLYVDKVKHNFEIFNGNYEKYLKIKEEKDKARERLIAKQSDEEEKLKRIIAKYLHGTEKQANIAKDRIKKLEKLKQVKVEAEKKQKITKFKIKINYPSTSIPIEVNHLKFGYDENNLLYNDLSFTIQRGEKILIVGENGIGKTTLLRLIMGTLKPIDGEIKINDKTLISYYAQEHEIIDNSKTILNNFNNYVCT